MKKITVLFLLLIATINLLAQVKTQPEGELRIYKRSGYAYMMDLADMGTPVKATQEGLLIEIVFAPDGKTIWMKDILSYMNRDSWVSGTIDGNKIRMKTGQIIERLNNSNANCRLAVMDFDGDSYVADNSITEVTFTIDGDNISLDDMYESHILSAYWDDNDMWVRYGVWESVYSPFDEIPIVVPDNIEKTVMPIFAYNEKDEYDDDVTVGRTGYDVYIQGISHLVKDGWVKGTLSNNVLTIPSGQYIGKYNDIPLYICGSTSNNQLVDITFDYDAAKNIFTQNTPYIVANGRKSEMAYVDIYYMMTIGEKQWTVATPAPPTIEGYFEKDEIMDAMLFFTPSTYDIDDNALRKKNIFYQIYSDVDGNENIVTFDNNLYELDSDMTDFPYYFIDNNYYFGYLDYLNMWVATLLMDVSDWQRIGVRMGYTASGETQYSDIVWTNMTDAVGEAADTKQMVSSKVYDLQGRLLNEAPQGIVIEQRIYQDGSVENVKKLIK